MTPPFVRCAARVLHQSPGLFLCKSATLIYMMHKRMVLTVIGFVVVVALAIGFRFYGIQDYPPGLFPDQAANGEDALLILQGDARPFYERGNGREALFFFIQAASIKLFGVGVWPMFAASALVGVLAVAAVFFATRPIFGRMAALLAAFFMATSYWQVTISRTGFRAGLIPLCIAAFTAFAAYAVWTVGHKEKGLSYVFAALAGVAFSLGFYTYIAYRMMPFVVLAMLFLLVLASFHPKIGFPHVRRYGWQTLVGLLAAVVTLVPLLWYFGQHREAFIGRAGQVSIFSPDLQKKYGGGTLLGTLAYSTTETVRSFFIGQGDLNFRHSVPGRPLVNPLVSFLLLMGLVWALSGCWQMARRMVAGKEVHLTFAHAYLVILLVAMLVPVVTTAEGMPHGLRSEGAVVPVFMLAGMAGAVIIHALLKRVKDGPWRGVGLGVVAGLMIVSALYDGAAYFLLARNDAEAYYEYRGDLTSVSQYLNEYAIAHGPYTASIQRPYLVLDEFSVQTVHFLTHVTNTGEPDTQHAHDFRDHPDEAKHKYVLLDPATSHLTALAAGQVIVFTQSTLPDADRYAEKYAGQVEILLQRKNRFGQEIMRVYKLRDGVVPSVDEADLDA